MDDAIPNVRPGTILQLAADDWEYGDGPLVVLVRRTRPDLSRYYGGKKLWVEGCRLDCLTEHEHCLQALVRVAALPGDGQQRF